MLSIMQNTISLPSVSFKLTTNYPVTNYFIVCYLFIVFSVIQCIIQNAISLSSISYKIQLVYLVYHTYLTMRFTCICNKTQSSDKKIFFIGVGRGEGNEGDFFLQR